MTCGFCNFNVRPDEAVDGPARLREQINDPVTWRRLTDFLERTT